MAGETQNQIDSALPDLEVATPSSPPDTVKKVELDLDDAPFLQPDEPARPPDTIDDHIPDVDDAGKKARKKKLIIIGAIAGVVALGLALVAVWWFFFRVPPPPPPEAPKPDVVVVPSTPVAPEKPEFTRSFEPFVVPVTDAQGKTSFLICQFSVIGSDPKVNQEITQQMTPLRDAVYYYLRGKDSLYLINHANAQTIKKDLVSIFNDYLSQGKIEDIALESYLNN